MVSNARLHKWKEAPILPSRNIIAIVVAGSTQFDEPADHDIPPNSPYFLASSTVWSSTSIPSIPVRGTFTPVSAVSCGGTVSPGGMMIPIGAISLSSRCETPRSRVFSLADEEEEGRRVIDWLRRITWML